MSSRFDSARGDCCPGQRNWRRVYETWLLKFNSSAGLCEDGEKGSRVAHNHETRRFNSVPRYRTESRKMVVSHKDLPGGSIPPSATLAPAHGCGLSPTSSKRQSDSVWGYYNRAWVGHLRKPYKFCSQVQFLARGRHTGIAFWEGTCTTSKTRQVRFLFPVPGYMYGSYCML